MEENAKLTTKDGLLYCNGEMVPLPEADEIARNLGHLYVERLISDLEEQQKQSTVKTFPPLVVISRKYFNELNPHIECPECGKEIEPKLKWSENE